MIRCVAIDDEPPALELLKDYIARFPSLQLVQTFDDAISGAEFLAHTNIDLLFIDINMPDVSGLELVRALKEKPLIVFTTAYKKFAFEGFELEALDYLLKPIDFTRFTRTIQKAIEYLQYKKTVVSDDSESLFVHSEYRLVKIPLSDIEYIESLEDYIRIHLISQKSVMTLMPLKKVLEKLPASKFKRIHRSYIVSVNKVRSVLNRKVTLSSSKELPVSDSYADFINEWKSK